MCPGTTDFKVMREKKAAFEGIKEEIEVIGFVTCGGCPGKKAVSRAAEMVRRGADTIVLCSCMTRGNPIGYPCPHAQAIREALIKKLGDGIRLIEYTH